MKNPEFFLLGLGLGGCYALMALGVVSIYRASGVPNFAQGAVAMASAFTFFNLRDSVGDTAAFVLTIGLAGLFGAGFYILVMRQLRNSPLMARIAATIALLLLLHGLAITAFPLATTTPTSILPQNLVQIGGLGIPVDRFIVAGIAVVAAVVLEILARRTRFGLATRAIAETEKGVILLGLSPIGLGAANWAIGSVLAALAGILLTPFAGLNADALTQLIVPVFAVALLAKFVSFPRAVLASFALGMMQSYLQQYSAPGPWYTALWQGPGRVDALPALVVFVAMLFSGKLIPPRDEVLRGRLPSSVEPRNLRIGIPVLLVAGTLLVLLVPLNWSAAVTTSIIATILGASLVLLTGITGQISLAQLAFAGVGGFLAARLYVIGVPFLPDVLAAGAVGGLLGLVVGLPALRIRGPSLAIMTLAIGLVLYDLVLTNGELLPASQFLRLDYPLVGSWRLGPRSFGVLCLVVLAAVLSFVALIRRSPFGLRSLLVRESERSAVAAGINVSFQKLSAFFVSSTIAGVGGALLAFNQLVFSYEGYAVLASLMLFVVAYIGGIGMASGAVIAGLGAGGGIFSNLLASAHATSYSEIIAGAGLLIAIQLHPDGLAAVPEAIRGALANKREARHQGAKDTALASPPKV